MEEITLPVDTVWLDDGKLGVAIVQGDSAQPETLPDDYDVLGLFVAPASWAQYDQPCERCNGNGRLWRLDKDGTAEPCPDCHDGRQVWTVRWPCPVAQFDVGQATDGAALIALERRRQVDSEGWTPAHDAEHADGALARAAVVYASFQTRFGGLRQWWPWDAKWLKVSDDPVRNLVKAGALIAAEIDRIQGGWQSAPAATIQVVPVVASDDLPDDWESRWIIEVNPYGEVWLHRPDFNPLYHSKGLLLDPLPTPGRDFAVTVWVTP